MVICVEQMPSHHAQDDLPNTLAILLSHHITCFVCFLGVYIGFIMKAVFLIALLPMAALANEAPLLQNELGALSLPSAHDIHRTPIAALPTPTASVTNIDYIPTTLIPQNTQNDGKVIDSTMIDDFLTEISPNARHYPPNFPNRTAQHVTRENLKHLSQWIEPYASAKDASIEVLLRAAKINIMARNLDLGSDYSLRASNHLSKALKLNPKHEEANFLYGMMLSEGGAFKEGKKYLDIAANLGYLEAEQSLAQADLLTDNPTGAIARLQRLSLAHPQHPQLAKQLEIAQNGGYYIWNIKSTQPLNLKRFAQP